MLEKDLLTEVWRNIKEPIELKKDTTNDLY